MRNICLAGKSNSKKGDNNLEKLKNYSIDKYNQIDLEKIKNYSIDKLTDFELDKIKNYSLDKYRDIDPTHLFFLVGYDQS